MAKRVGTHETYGEQVEVKRGSERSLGIVFAVVFAIIACLPLLKGKDPILWCAYISGAFLFLGLLLPITLRPLNWLWFKFGLLLSAIMVPLIMGIVFFLVVTPIGIIMRALGNDPMRLSSGKESDTYWIFREDVGPPPETMKNQF